MVRDVAVYSMEGKRKRAFFEQLYKLDDDSDGPEDKSNIHAILAKSKIPPTQSRSRNRKNQLNDSSPRNKSLDRTVSAPVVRASVPFPVSTAPALVSRQAANLSDIGAAPEPGITGHKEQVLGTGTSVSTKAGRKRKRGHSFNGLPVSQQIFKGLSFFFFPNNDVAAARGFRIRKSMEWGAAWIKTWKQGITHIIMDKSLTYKDLLTFLKIQALPQSVVLVNEDYPADCIRFRFVVNPQQPQYLVAGHGDATKSPLAAPSTPTKRSLQIKRNKDQLAYLLETPSKTDESAMLEVSSNGKPKIDHDVTHVTDSMPSSMGEHARDALSEAIEEAKAVQGLVGPPIPYCPYLLIICLASRPQ